MKKTTETSLKNKNDYSGNNYYKWQLWLGGWCMRPKSTMYWKKIMVLLRAQFGVKKVLCFQLPSSLKTFVPKIFIWPFKNRCRFLFACVSAILKQNCLHLICYVYFSSVGYYLVCRFVFMTCCVIYIVHQKSWNKNWILFALSYSPHPYFFARLQLKAHEFVSSLAEEGSKLSSWVSSITGNSMGDALSGFAKLDNASPIQYSTIFSQKLSSCTTRVRAYAWGMG